MMRYSLILVMLLAHGQKKRSAPCFLLANFAQDCLFANLFSLIPFTKHLCQIGYILTN
jgi:hypothetical protein